MTSHFEETSPEIAALPDLAYLQAAAGRLGMRLVPVEVGEPQPVVATRHELAAYATAAQIPQAVAYRGWRRLQELYTAKVQYQTLELETAVPHDTPLKFLAPPPLPDVHPEKPENWVSWQLRLTKLDTESLEQFMIQLDNAESRFGRNRYVDLLGKMNGKQMVNLLQGFVELKLSTANEA